MLEESLLQCDNPFEVPLQCDNPFGVFCNVTILLDMIPILFLAKRTASPKFWLMSL
jgi:hypothetical protein